MSTTSQDIAAYRAMVVEAKAARDRDGIVSVKGDELVGLSDAELYQRLTGRSAPLVDVEQAQPRRGGVVGQGTASRYRPTGDVRSLAGVNERKANRYGARCITCNGWVEAEQGYLAKTAAGKWAAEHKDSECVQAPVQAAAAPVAAPAPATAPVEQLKVTDGFYELDGVAYKVQANQAGTGLYGKKLVDGSWEYVPGVVRVLQAGGATKLTEALASHLGALYGRCVICGRKLTAEESIERSIGRICFEKNF